MSPTKFYNSQPSVSFDVDYGAIRRMPLQFRTAIALKLSLQIEYSSSEQRVSVSALARALKVSWTTAKKELLKLIRYGLIRETESGYRVTRNAIESIMVSDEIMQAYRVWMKALYNV